MPKNHSIYLLVSASVLSILSVAAMDPQANPSTITKKIEAKNPNNLNVSEIKNIFYKLSGNIETMIFNLDVGNIDYYVEAMQHAANNPNITQEEVYQAFSEIQKENVDKNPKLSRRLKIWLSHNQLDFAPLKNVSGLANIVRPGDWVILDIDETLLTGKGEHLLNLDPQVPELIKNWQQAYPKTEGSKQIRVILLIARKGDEQETRDQLEKAGFPRNIEIIFAPNDKSTGGKIPTKGSALAKDLMESSQKPNRLFVVDYLKVNLSDIQNALKGPEFSQIDLLLLLKQVHYKLYQTPMGRDEASITFPDQLTDDLAYVQAIGGGSGGVHVLQSKLTGQKFTFKCVADPQQMKEEVTADALYRSLEIKVPAFAVYDQLPNISQIQRACQGPGPYRLAQFIKGDETTSQDLLAQRMQDHFVADAFLSNWDIVIGNFKNVILDKKGTLWRIDNGGSLRYRAVGDRKTASQNWNPNEVTELTTMRDSSLSPEGSKVYGGLTDEQLKAQAQKILDRSSKLLDTLDQVSQAIHLDNPSEVKEMLRRRLDDLVQRFGLTIPDWTRRGTQLSLIEHPATEKSAAGVLVYSFDPKTNKPMILLSQRIRHNWWGDFGGKSDVVGTDDLDKSLADTAVREVKEESRGLLSFTPLELAKTPSHQIVNDQGVLYRMYLAPYQYFDVEKLNTAPEVPAYHWTKEHTDYAWVSMEDLLGGINGINAVSLLEEGEKTIKISINNQDFILYPPFLKMVQEPQVKEMLLALVKGHKPMPRHTQQEPTAPAQPVTLEEEKQQLAETVVKKGAVGGEIKASDWKLKHEGTGKDLGYSYATPEKENETSVEDMGKIKSMAGYLSDEQAQRIRETLSKSTYTQTQGYLSYIMGEEKLAELKGDSAAEVETFLENYAQFRDRMKDMDEHYKRVLIEAMDAEKAPENRDKVVFYHGTDPLTSFIFDVYTAYRSQLKTLSPDQLTALRGLEMPFNSILDIEEFINTFRNPETGGVYNYNESQGVNYADMGLSVNPFLFGNDGNPTNATYYLFYLLSSVGAPDHEKLFNAFMSATGIPGKFKDYKALYQQYYLHNNRENSKLYQIFVDPQVADATAYMAYSGGDVIEFPLDDGSSYHGFSKIMAEERSAIKDFEKRLRMGKTSHSHVNYITPDDIQARLYLKPEIFHNPAYVTIKSYWRHDVPQDVAESYRKKLNEQVSQDLSRWLPLHSTLEDKTFVEGTPKLKELYKQVYEGVTGLKYTEVEAKSLLPLAIAKGDVDMIRKLFDKYPDIDLNKGVLNVAYRGNKSSGSEMVPVLDIIENASNFSDLVRLLLEKGLNIDTKNTEGLTLLDVAMYVGDEKLLERLMETITSLSFKSHISSERAPTIVAALGNNKTIKSLTLGRWPITGQALASALAKVLETNNTLTSINLGEVSIGDEGVEALAKALETNASVVTLTMGRGIGTKGAMALAKALEKNKTLKLLRIEWNFIGSKEAIALAAALEKNAFLIVLDLTGNEIGDDGTSALANMLMVNTTLKSLNLTYNGISNVGVTALSQALSKNRTLTFLNLSNNKQITLTGLGELTKTLRENNDTLETLIMKGHSLNLDKDIIEKFKEKYGDRVVLY